MNDRSNSQLPRFRIGIELFNSGEYFEAHEALEDAWRAAPAADKQFLQGMVQAAVGMHHLHAANYIGARGVLARAIRNLEPYSPTRAGVDVERLLTSLRACLACAEEGEGTPAKPQMRAAPEKTDNR